jgi:SAM-dependent methyltransferase
MSRLLDPMHRRHIERLGIGPGARTLEVGCGNGSMSAWLAQRVAPGGRALAVDLDLSLASAGPPGLELRQADILAGPVEPGDFDLVTARAVLHHVGDAEAAVTNLLASVRPGGAVLLIEPDFLPVSVAEPAEVRTFWAGWLAWAQEQEIDYFIGRRLPALVSRLGLEHVEATAETALYRGRSLWAQYWRQTVLELRPRLTASGHLDDRSVDAFLAYCDDPAWWTQTIAFTAVDGRAPRRRRMSAGTQDGLHGPERGRGT